MVDQICDRADQHLRPGGALLLLHSSVCGVEESLVRLSDRGLEAGVVFRHRGQLGPLLRSRSDWLREQGLLPDGDHEDVVIIRAERPARGTALSPERTEQLAAAAGRLSDRRPRLRQPGPQLGVADVNWEHRVL